ncbi:hypothetical protein CAPTEDRAFT_108955, partial [Capitella teleta]
LNELPSLVEFLVYLFADNTKIFRSMRVPSNSEHLQRDLNTLHSWTESWLLHFHPGKCKVLEVPPKSMLFHVTLRKKNYQSCSSIRDSRVIIDAKLGFKEHLNNKIQMANKVLAIIRRSFPLLDADTLILLYKSLIRPHLK